MAFKTPLKTSLLWYDARDIQPEDNDLCLIYLYNLEKGTGLYRLAVWGYNSRRREWGFFAGDGYYPADRAVLWAYLPEDDCSNFFENHNNNKE